MTRDFSSSEGPRQAEREAELRFARTSPERFDRLAFALAALRVLRPQITVALFERRRSLIVERGRDLSRGPDAIWAMVGIPPDASREHIVLALAELAGVADVPFLVDLLRRIDPTSE